MDRATEEALCDAQAQLCVLRIALRAFARTHPDPAALLAAWREALAEACDPVAPSDPRSSDYLADRIRARAEDWTAELVELAVPDPPPAIPMSSVLQRLQGPRSPGDGIQPERRSSP